jgi:DNA replication licensing factor MCM5
MRTPYVRVVGLDIEGDRSARGMAAFTPEDEARYIEMSRRPDIYSVFASSIAPSIYGNEGQY